MCVCVFFFSLIPLISNVNERRGLGVYPEEKQFLNSCNVYYFRQKKWFWVGGGGTAIYELYSRLGTRQKRVTEKV